jgi:rod shape-determining protein MreC
VLSLLRRYRELILVAVLLLFPLAVFFANAKKPSQHSRVDRAVLSLTAPLEKGVGVVVVGVLNAWDGYVALRGAHRRAGLLGRENDALQLQVQQLRHEATENDRLRKLLAIAEAAPARSYTGARVIGVRAEPSGLQLVTLDKGSDDGLSRGMPVITGQGVLGRIHSTGGGSADVLLAIDRNSSIAVRVERTRARANVRGLGRPGLARLDHAVRSEDVIEGDLLVTSGTDAIFPAGLPVGRVTGLQRAAHGLFLEGSVIPVVDPTRVEEVLVITSGARNRDQPASAEGTATGRSP